MQEINSNVSRVLECRFTVTNTMDISRMIVYIHTMHKERVARYIVYSNSSKECSMNESMYNRWTVNERTSKVSISTLAGWNVDGNKQLQD